MPERMPCTCVDLVIPVSVIVIAELCKATAEGLIGLLCKSICLKNGAGVRKQIIKQAVTSHALLPALNHCNSGDWGYLLGDGRHL